MGKAEYFRGNLERSANLFEQSLICHPTSHGAHSNLLLSLNYLPDQTQESLFKLHKDFDRRHCQSIATFTYPQIKPQDPGRRIKIGYLSPDLRGHSIAFFIAPVFMNHNRERFEIFAYYNHNEKDGITANFRACSDHWRDIADLTDRQVADLIRKDGIDILVDLAGHSAHNRLLTFAHKPAPVQVAWLGYPNTTGLAAMDYRLTDEETDPTGSYDTFYSEKLIRLPETFLCYSPLRKCPDISSLPAIKNNYITFASLNNFSKINSEVIRLWIRLLKEIPGSKQILIYNGGTKSWLDSAIHKATSSKEIPFAALRSMSNFLFAKSAFENNGISPDRVTIYGRSPSDTIHLQHYSNIDIALDPFPYNGTTTTFESLWMGVPVIALEGNRHASRVSAGILKKLGIAELVGKDPDGYITAARTLAEDKEKLAFLRSSLRNIMSNSALMNAQQFTANLEYKYRVMLKHSIRESAT